MSLQQSPGIVTSGLTFYYDMNNTQKSFKGAPTTNYVSDAASMSGWNNYSNTANGTPAQFMTEFGTIGYRMDNVGSWNGVYRGISLPSTGTYTFSAWIKWVGGSSNVTGGAVYVSGWGGGDSATATNRTLPGQWQRVSLTLNCTTTSMTFYLICWGGTNNADHSSWQVTMPQVEAGSYATPFINGSRTTSQNLTDLTNTYTVTTTNLSYASDNTFSFNGASSVVNIGPSTRYLPLQSHTLEAWIKSPGLGSGMSTSGVFGITYGLIVQIQSGGVLGYYSYNTDSGSSVLLFSVNSTGVNLFDNTWHHIVCTRDSTTASIYIDGVLNATTSGGGTWSGTNIWSSMDAYIGYNPNNIYYWANGYIASAKIYKRALSASEVSQNFAAHRIRYGR